MNEHKHSIMIIRNQNNEYLNYYDERWNSYLFLNNKVNDDTDDNIQKEFIAKKLNVPKESIELTIIYEKIHTKYSESAKKEKDYHHYFYDVKIKSFEKLLLKKEFTINETNYKWFSMGELESDKRIQEVNSDIVAMVKELRGD